MVEVTICIAMAMPLIMMLVIMVLFALSYRKVPPNRALVLFKGTPDREMKVLRTIQGGGRFMPPGGMSSQELDMTVDLTEFEMTGVPTDSGGYPTSLRLRVAALWKINSIAEVLEEKAGGLMDRTQGENKMAVKEQLEAAFRNLSGGMGSAAFEKGMTSIRQRATLDANQALAELGLEILTVRVLHFKPQG